MSTKLGTIKGGHKLGYKTETRHIWAKCEGCNYKRWAKMLYGEAEHKLCRRCAAKRAWRLKNL